jgi:predicted Zn-dependent protease
MTQTSRTERIARPAALIPVLLVVAACSNRPHAPPLTAEAVYQNDAIGLRFLAPAGWPVQSRATLPTGRLAKPIILVSYQRVPADKPAEFKVLAADLAPETTLVHFLTDVQVGPETWSAPSGAQPLSVNGAEATRFVQSRTQGKEEYRREVTAFRRGDRVYLFLVIFPASDAASRDAVRTAVASVTWTKSDR